MHATSPVIDFLKSFSAVSKAVPSRSPKAVLMNVLFTAPMDGPATFSGTDLEVGLQIQAPGVTVLSPGRCLLPPKVATALSNLPKNAILDIVVEGDKIRLSTETWSHDLPSEDPDLYPAIPGGETGDEFATVAADDFKRSIERSTYATDVASTRFALGGCLFERDDAAHLVMVATDGRRLVKTTIPADFEADPDKPPVRPVVSRRFLELVAGLADPDANVSLRMDGSRATIAAQPDWSAYGRNVEGRFPEYASVFPDASSAVVRASINSAELLAAVNRASIACSEDSRGIDVEFDNTGVSLTAQSSDLGKSNGRVSATYEGVMDGMNAVPAGGVWATLDHRYLSELLKASAPETLTFAVIDHKNALIVRGDGDALLGCLMPLTRDR